MSWNYNTKKNIFITPHLSTGGLPQYLIKKVEGFLDAPAPDVFVIEYNDITGGEFVVQRNKIRSLLNNNLITLGEDKTSLIKFIEYVKPDYIHIEEFSETFISYDINRWLYRNDRSYKIIETSHGSVLKQKMFLPDEFLFVSPAQLDQYRYLGIPMSLVEYPIEYRQRPDRIEALNKLNLDPNKKHILNVGLFTPGKNQAEIFEYAKSLPDYQFHFVGNQAGNFADYWRPLITDKPDNCIVWGERADVELFYSAMDLFLFTSKLELNPLVLKEAIGWGLPILMYNLPIYQNSYNKYNNINFLTDNLDTNISLISGGKKINNNKIIIRYTDGAIVEILGDYIAEYRVDFINGNTNSIEYSTKIFNNCWANTNKKYLVDWLIRVYRNDQLIIEDKFDPTGKNVVIRFESSAIGDTIAWIPFVEEFRKKWNCEVFVSTFNNTLFTGNYPEVHFMLPGFNLDNAYADYKIGWFYKDNNIVDYNRNPIDFKRFPLQETPTSILGLDYKEIKPKITFPYLVPDIYDKYVVIAPHASAHAKYWNADNGWQTVIDYLNLIGYKVILIGTEKLGDPWHDSKLGGTFKNVIDKTGDIPLKYRMIDIRYASLFIGVGSGLSWLSWALDTKTMLISGFSEKYTEFSDCIRVGTTEKYACYGCFNTHRLDAGDWEWCPEHKNTSRMFECTKTIKPETVINEINKLLL